MPISILPEIFTHGREGRCLRFLYEFAEYIKEPNGSFDLSNTELKSQGVFYGCLHVFNCHALYDGEPVQFQGRLQPVAQEHLRVCVICKGFEIA